MTRIDPYPPASLSRRRAAAVALILAPVLTVVGSAAWPAGSDGSTGQELQAAASQPAMWAVASLLDLLPWVLLTAGAIGLVGYLRDRGRILGMIGAIGVAAGAVATIVVSGVNLLVVPVVAAMPDRAAAARFLDSVTGQPVAAAFILLIYVGLIGTILLAFGAMRGGLVRWWVPVLMLVGAIINAALNSGLTGFAAAATFVPYAAAGVLLGIALYRSGSRTSPVRRPAAATAAAAPEPVEA